jgi:glutathione S-transferase
MSMQLYQFAHSPFAAKVRKCLELKRLGCEIVEVPYLDRRALAAVSGGVHVPVLVDEGRVVTDSARITAYLDERYPPNLRPGALAGPATVLEAWADEQLEEVAFRLSAPWVEPRMREQSGDRADAPAMYRMIKERKYGTGCLDAWRADEATWLERLRGLIEPLVRSLALSPFLLGDTITVADAAVWGNLYGIEAVRPGFVAGRLPGLEGWIARVNTAGRAA